MLIRLLSKMPHIVVDGKRYRKCASALVINDHGLVLVGERVGKPGSWNMPQGGMDEGETPAQAASRELYEETGIKLSEGKCELVSEIKSDDKKTFCYDVPGGGWLGKEGFDGQCFEFSLFRLHNANTNEELNSLANLKGLNGEPAEFSQLKWLSFEDVIKTVWEVKRPAYQACYDVVKKMGAI
eukprot:m.13501 g.13501  ORF g.13501 m.13501 type:complete len:183 (-) comp4868_c0_seq1:209-757(-)